MFSRAGGVVYAWSYGRVTPDDRDRAAIVASHDGARSFRQIASYEADSGGGAAGDPRVIFVTTDHGLFVSRSGGASWQRTAAPRGSLHAITIAESRSDTLYVVGDISRTAVGDSGEEGTTQRLYRSLDGGRSWRSVLEMFDITSIDVAPSRHSTVYVTGTRIVEGRASVVVRRSGDAGSHWQTRFSQPSSGGATIPDVERTRSPNAGRLVVDPSDPAIVYRDTGARVEVSVDGGRNFRKLRSQVG